MQVNSCTLEMEATGFLEVFVSPYQSKGSIQEGEILTFMAVKT
jgi:hypothetical protein